MHKSRSQKLSHLTGSSSTARPHKTTKKPVDTSSTGFQFLAPQAGLEPATSWLTVMRSTDWAIEEYIKFWKFAQTCFGCKTVTNVLPTELLRNILNFGNLLKLVSVVRPLRTSYRLRYWGIYRKCRRSPIFPRRHHLSIFGVYELNFCVRNGNRWNLIAICTGFCIIKVLIKPWKLNKEQSKRSETEKSNVKVKPSTD